MDGLWTLPATPRTPVRSAPASPSGSLAGGVDGVDGQAQDEHIQPVCVEHTFALCAGQLQSAAPICYAQALAYRSRTTAHSPSKRGLPSRMQSRKTPKAVIESSAACEVYLERNVARFACKQFDNQIYFNLTCCNFASFVGKFCLYAKQVPLKRANVFHFYLLYGYFAPMDQ